MLLAGLPWCSEGDQSSVLLNIAVNAHLNLEVSCFSSHSYAFLRPHRDIASGHTVLSFLSAVDGAACTIFVPFP